MKAEVLAEFLGTALLLAVVVGSGIMGERLAGGNDAIALLANSLATGAGLYVLIVTLGPVSGAQFNPAVSVLLALQGRQEWGATGAYVAAQFGGAISGVLIAHGMFAETLLQVSTHVRAGPAQWLSEFVATAGLLGTILLCLRHRPEKLPQSVGLYIMAAYWFTASTSFANPAVTLARMLTDTFAGIAPAGVPGFIGAQLAAVAVLYAATRHRGIRLRAGEEAGQDGAP
jgi:glycerol uptake facilitator-like aquaporin